MQNSHQRMRNSFNLFRKVFFVVTILLLSIVLISCDEFFQGGAALDGKEVVFNVSDTHIQWRYEGSSEWIDLVSFEVLTGHDGLPGADGREVEFNVNDTHIQWRYEGDTEFTDLVSLSIFKLVTGNDGKDGNDGLDGISVVSANIDNDGNLILTLSNGQTLNAGLVQGVSGREVEFRVNDTHIQWRYVGEETWLNLVSLETLKGNDGLPGLPGTNGREVEFSVNETHIQWKYSDEVNYTNLISLDLIKGLAGTNGLDGKDGNDGLDGISIVDAVVNELGELVLSLSDGSTINAGRLLNVNIVLFKDYNGYVIDTQLVLTGEEALAPALPVREGHTFVSWDKDFDEITEDIVISPIYTRNELVVLFDGINHEEEVLYGDSLLSLPAGNHLVGYKFIGWFTEEDLKVTTNTVIYNNLVLYPKYEKLALEYVRTEADLINALNNPLINTVVLVRDITLSNDLLIEKGLNIYTNSYTFNLDSNTLEFGQTLNYEEYIIEGLFINGEIVLDNTNGHFELYGHVGTNVDITVLNTYLSSAHISGNWGNILVSDSNGVTYINARVTTLVTLENTIIVIMDDFESVEEPVIGGEHFIGELGKLNITFIADGNIYIEQEVERGNPAVRPTNPFKEGYLFVGWLLDEELYDFITPLVSHETLYAKFELVTELDVSDEVELRDALLNVNIREINLLNDINLANKLVIERDDITLNGNGFSLIINDLPHWNSNYIIHVYNAVDISINDLKLVGGDAALLVNGSLVTITNLELVGQEFGGIEVSLGVGLVNNPKLTVVGTLDADLGSLPVIWIDQMMENDEWVIQDLFNEFIMNDKNQVWFTYLDFVYEGVLNHELNTIYETITAAISNARSGDHLTVSEGTFNEVVIIDKALTLRSYNGSENTTINAGGANYAVQIATNNLGVVTVEGFSVVNWTRGGINQPMASGGPNSSFRVIGNNVISPEESLNHGNAIQVSGDNSVVSGNTITVSHLVSEDYFSTGILVVNASNVLVEYNVITGSDVAVSVQGGIFGSKAPANGVEISNNVIEDILEAIVVDGNIADLVIFDNNISLVKHALRVNYNEAYTTEVDLEEVLINNNFPEGFRILENVIALIRTVSFESNDGSLVDTVEVVDGESILKPVNPNKLGYTFNNWFTTEALTEAFDFGLSIDKDLTLYAKWDINEYTVTYMVDGEIHQVDTYDFGSEITILPPLTKEGYTFSGWDIELPNVMPANNIVVTGSFTKDTVYFNVVFMVEGEEYLSVQVIEHESVLKPEEPTKLDHIFMGWLLDDELFDFDSSITEDIVLVASFELEVVIPDGIAITTALEFYNMTMGSNGFSLTETYYLANDIDFKNFVWEQTGSGQNFRGILDGNNKTISNLNIVDIGDKDGYGGIFQKLGGTAEIRNLTIENAKVVSTGRGAVLVGSSEGSNVIENITIINSEFYGGDNNGAALIIGQNRNELTTVNNIRIHGSYVYSTGKSVGFIVGYARHQTVITNVLVTYSDLKTANTDTTASLGGIIGQARRDDSVEPENAVLIEVENVVLLHVTLIARGAGVVLGNNHSADSITIKNVYGEVSFINEGSSNGNHGLIGRTEYKTEYSLVIENVWGLLTGVQTGNNQTPIDPNNVLKEPFSSESLSENIPSLLNEKIFDELFGDEIIYNTIQFVVNGGNTVRNLVVIFGYEGELPTATRTGYEFLGWYKDFELTEAWLEDDVVEEDVMLYAKWKDITPPVISIETNQNSLLILPTDSFTLEVKVIDDNLDKLTVDIDLEDVLQLVLVPNSDNPYFDEDFELGFTQEGGQISYDDLTQIFTINFGRNITQGRLIGTVDYTLNAIDKEGNEALTVEFTFTLDVVTDTQIVSFDTQGGNVVADIEVPKGSMLYSLPTPVRQGYDFIGWFKEADGIEEWGSTDVVEDDIVLYAKWTERVPEGIAITTAAQFISVFSANDSKNYYLANDIDFAGIEWVQTTSTSEFSGKLDGNFKTIRNISITSGTNTGIRAGIFQATNNAIIENLIIINANVDVNGRAGILIGENKGSIISNVTIINSSIKGTVNEGVGVVFGQLASGKVTEINNVKIENSHSENSAKNVGVIAGRVDGILNITSLIITDSSATGLTKNTDSAVSVLVGYLNNTNAEINGLKIVVLNTKLFGRGAGYVIGYNNESKAVHLEDSYFEVTIENNQSDAGSHGIVGRTNNKGSAPIFINVWSFEEDFEKGSQATQHDIDFVLDNKFNSSELGVAIPKLLTDYFFDVLFIEVEEPNEFNITFDVDGGTPVPPAVTVLDGELLNEPEEPTKAGYRFLGWFTENNEDSFDFTAPIDEDIHLIARWEEIIYVRDASIIYDFSDLKGKGTLLTNTTATNIFENVSLDKVEVNNFTYDGNGTGGIYPQTAGLLKFGNSSNNGELTIYLKEEILISKVVIYADPWDVSSILTLDVNDVKKEISGQGPTRIEFDLLQETSKIQINLNARGFIFKIELYGADAEIVVPQSFNVTFNLGYEGSPDPQVVSVLENQKVDKPANPSRDGNYIFLGWFKDEETEFDFDDLITDDLVLFAKWEEISELEPTPWFTENFEDALLPSSYSDGTFTSNGVNWVYGHSRDEETFPIDGKGLMLRRASDSYLEFTIISDGGYLTFDYMKAFTGNANRQLEIILNGNQIATTSTFGGELDAGKVFTLTTQIVVKGAITIRIKNVGSSSSNAQTTIDNISWSEQAPVAPEEYEVTFDLGYEDAPEPTIVTVIEGNKLSKPANPTRTGYAFKWWALDGDEVEFDFDTVIDSSLTLIAIWDEEDPNEPVDQILYETSFENASNKASYALGTSTDQGITWSLSEALIGELADDKKVDSRSIRGRGPGFARIDTKFEEVSKIEFSYAHYGTLSQGSLSLQISSDDGATWATVWTMPSGTQAELLNVEVVLNYETIDGINSTDSIQIQWLFGGPNGNNSRMNIDVVKIYG